jgi:hypothetical protein
MRSRVADPRPLRVELAQALLARVQFLQRPAITSPVGSASCRVAFALGDNPVYLPVRDPRRGVGLNRGAVGPR